MQDTLFEAPKTYDRTPKPTSSPWGQVDHAEEIAPGIWSVGTPSHGGVKLSVQRQKDMPAYMRMTGGWYEEDCDWGLVALVFKAEFDVLRAWQKPGDRTHYACAVGIVKDWNPDAYEKFTGEIIPAGESYVKRKQEAARANAENFVTIAAWGDWAKFVPEGMVGVVAKLGGRDNPAGAEKWFLVPKDEYKNNSEIGFVIDLTKHQEIVEPRAEDRS